MHTLPTNIALPTTASLPPVRETAEIVYARKMVVDYDKIEKILGDDKMAVQLQKLHQEIAGTAEAAEITDQNVQELLKQFQEADASIDTKNPNNIRAAEILLKQASASADLENWRISGTNALEQEKLRTGSRDPADKTTTFNRMQEQNWWEFQKWLVSIYPQNGSMHEAINGKNTTFDKRVLEPLKKPYMQLILPGMKAEDAKQNLEEFKGKVENIMNTCMVGYLGTLTKKNSDNVVLIMENIGFKKFSKVVTETFPPDEFSRSTKGNSNKEQTNVDVLFSKSQPYSAPKTLLPVQKQPTNPAGKDKPTGKGFSIKG